MRTITVTSAWFGAIGMTGDGGWSTKSNALTQNDSYSTAPSSTSAYNTYPNGHVLTGYGYRFTDPRSGLPANYSNFTITAIQVQAKGHNNLASLGGGQHISPLSCGLFYKTDTTPWIYPRNSSYIFQTPTASNVNTWFSVFTFTQANQNSNVNTAGNDTFSPSKVFADAAAAYDQGPQIRTVIHNTTATAVGTWNIDIVRARFVYTYQLPDLEGTSNGAKRFFDFK